MDEAAREVVVVGAGPNGLAAAVTLARGGYAVEVHEAAPHTGGGAHTAELTLPGFHHDVCSTAHPLAAVSPFFASLPLADHGVAWVHSPIALAHPFADGSAAVLARDLQTTAAEMGADRVAYLKLMQPRVRRATELFAEALAPPLHLPLHPLLLADFALDALQPALALARRRFATARAQALFAGIAAHGLVPLDRSPSAGFALILALAAHASGWPFARGGSRALADALAAELRRWRGEIRTASRIESLAPFSGARAILLDLTPRQVLAVAGARLPRRYRRHLQRYRYGPGVFKVDWALAEPIPWTAPACRQAGTVHLGGDAEEIASTIAAAFAGRHAPQPFVILTQPSLWDRSRAPAGRHTAWAYCHVPHGSTRDMTAAIEGQVERLAPGFSEIVLARHTMDCRALERHDANLVGGDIAGGAEDLRQFFARPAPRLDPYATPAAGLYLCSAATPPGGGVHGMCGHYAARSALRRLCR